MFHCIQKQGLRCMEITRERSRRYLSVTVFFGIFKEYRKYKNTNLVHNNSLMSTMREAFDQFETKKCFMTLLSSNIMLMVAKPDVEITIEDAKHSKQIADIACYGDYGYLLDRRNTYSVKYGTYLYLGNNPRLKCIAVVSYRKHTDIIFSLEKNFVDKPFERFHDV